AERERGRVRGRDGGERNQRRVGALEDQQRDRAHLRHRLRLAQGGGGDHPPLARRDRAEDGDDQLARKDDNHHPRRDQALLDKDDEDRQDEELVRQRVEELAQVAHHARAAGELAVERVGEREQDEQRGGDLVVTGEVQQQERHQDG